MTCFEVVMLMVIAEGTLKFRNLILGRLYKNKLNVIKFFQLFKIYILIF